MIKNKILDFIIQSIQQGDKKAGDIFYSEKQLSIKFNTSHSTAKNALLYAEGMGLLKSVKGKGRFVNDFSRYLFWSSFLNTDEYITEHVFYDSFDKNEVLYFTNEMEINSNKITNCVIVNLMLNEECIAKHYSFINDENLLEKIKSVNGKNNLIDQKPSGDFLSILKNAGIIMKSIERNTLIKKDMIVVVRNITSSKDILVEYSHFIIKPNHFLRHSKIEFSFS